MSEQNPRITKMGSNLDELDAKYGKKPTSKEPVVASGDSHETPMMTGSIVELLNAKRDAYRRWLESMSFYSDVIPAKEIETMQGIFERCGEIIDEYDGSENEEIGLQNLETYLDGLSFWVAKFSTELSGGAGHSLPLLPSSEDDSIYYMSPSGMCLRLKKVLLKEESLSSVVQPIAERVYFEKNLENTREISLTPVVGYSVQEIFTVGLNKALSEYGVRGDFSSRIRVYKEGGKPAAVVVLEDDRFATHSGDRVNRIFEL